MAGSDSWTLLEGCHKLSSDVQIRVMKLKKEEIIRFVNHHVILPISVDYTVEESIAGKSQVFSIYAKLR